jgi:uncharacterized membrane protein
MANDKMTIENIQKQFDEFQKDLFPKPRKKNKILIFLIPFLMIIGLVILFYLKIF